MKIGKKIALATVAVLTLGTAVNAADKKMGVSMPTLSGPWYTAILYGLTTQAEEMGYELVVLDAGGYGNVDNQISQVSNLITQQVDAILLDPANPASFNGVAREARAAGIPMLGVASAVTGSEVEPDGAVSSSHCDLGITQAEGAKQLLPDGGSVGMLAGPAGAYWASDRVRCFKEELEGTNIEVVAEINGEQDIAVALGQANDILQRFPDISMLYAVGDTMGAGAARAVQQIGQCDDIKVLIAVLSGPVEELMKQGCIDFVVAQKPVKIARDAVILADGLINGTEEFGQVIKVPSDPVTPETLADVNLDDIRQPDDWRP